MACRRRDHGSNSNDCCRGSLSQLMTSATVLRKVSVLLSGVTPSACLSVSREKKKKKKCGRPFCGKPCDKNGAGGYKCFHLFIHPHMKKVRHSPPQSGGLTSIRVTRVLTHPFSPPPAIPHIGKGGGGAGS